MKTYKIDITDAQDAGVTFAREQRNASLSDGDPTFKTNQDYLQDVLAPALASYRQQAFEASIVPVVVPELPADPEAPVETPAEEQA